MSFKNFLDLRKKSQPRIQIVERLIIQKRSWKSDVFLALSVILVASAVVWGVSKADNVITQVISRKPVAKNFSASGIISVITDGAISIDSASGSNDESQTAYTFGTSDLKTIETSQRIPMTLFDIKLGDKVVVQGNETEGNISIKRLIDFRTDIQLEATSTDATSTATTTEQASSTIDATSTPAQVLI